MPVIIADSRRRLECKFAVQRVLHTFHTDQPVCRITGNSPVLTVFMTRKPQKMTLDRWESVSRCKASRCRNDQANEENARMTPRRAFNGMIEP